MSLSLSRRKQLKPRPAVHEEKPEQLNGLDLLLDQLQRAKEEGEEGSATGDSEELEPPQKKLMRLIENVNVKLETDDCFESIAGENPFDCQLCEEKFPSIAALQDHTLSRHIPQAQPSPPSSLTCQQCGQKLPSLPAFAVHMRSHIGADREQSCPLCQERFEDEKTRLDHLTAHYSQQLKRSGCADCPELLFSTERQMVEHCLSEHVSTIYRCRVCDTTFDDQHALKAHLPSHSLDRSVVGCSVCQTPFQNKQLLAVHVQLVHDKEPLLPLNPFALGGPFSIQYKDREEKAEEKRELRVLSCSVCDARCVGEEALDEHRLFSHCKVPHASCCAECHLPISSHSDFLAHCHEHARDAAMVCVVCRQSLRSESQLQLHCSFHMARGEEEERASSAGEGEECGVCGKTFPLASLPLHLLEHDAMKACPHCKRVFSLAHLLFDHVEKQHLQEQPLFACGRHCGRRFRFAIHYEHHKKREGLQGEMSSSSGSRGSSPSTATSYRCQQCPKTFSSVSSLQQHTSVHNTSKTTHNCPVCGLTFNTVTRMENHVRKHATASACVCQICGQQFPRKEDIVLHMQVHKGNLELGARQLIS